jgi:hypothetical protein
MTVKELRKITAEFNDVKPIIFRRNAYKKEEARIRRKLNTLEAKYSFLHTLVGIDSCGEPLVNAIRILFREMGVKKVENVDKKYRDEDLRLWTTDNRLIIFEITGIDKETVTDAKAFQIVRHIPAKKKQFPTQEVHAVFAVNRDNKKHYSKRHPAPFRKELVQTAINHDYVLTTTKDLFNAFILYKEGKLTSYELINKLCGKGELKI